MLKIKVKTAGFFIDKPNLIEILVDEKSPAAEYIDSSGMRKILTILDLYNLKRFPHFKNDIDDPEDQVTGETFEDWMFEKYVRPDPRCNRIIEIEYVLT